MFVRTGGTWSQQAELTASDRHMHDFFGLSAGISGNTAVVRAEGKDLGTGAAYVRSRTKWSLQTELTASDAVKEDLFSTSVAVSGQDLAGRRAQPQKAHGRGVVPPGGWVATQP